MLKEAPAPRNFKYWHALELACHVITHPGAGVSNAEFGLLRAVELAKAPERECQTFGLKEISRIVGGYIEGAKVFARALHCHPAVLVFPGWQIDSKHAA